MTNDQRRRRLNAVLPKPHVLLSLQGKADRAARRRRALSRREPPWTLSYPKAQSAPQEQAVHALPTPPPSASSSSSSSSHSSPSSASQTDEEEARRIAERLAQDPSYDPDIDAIVRSAKVTIAILSPEASMFIQRPGPFHSILHIPRIPNLFLHPNLLIDPRTVEGLTLSPNYRPNEPVPPPPEGFEPISRAIQTMSMKHPRPVYHRSVRPILHVDTEMD